MPGSSLSQLHSDTDPMHMESQIELCVGVEIQWLRPTFLEDFMRRGRTTTHENRVQRAGPRRRVSLWYKQRSMAVAGRSGNSVWTSIPSLRLTRVGKATIFCRTQRLGRTHSSVCTRPTAPGEPDRLQSLCGNYNSRAVIV